MIMNAYSHLKIAQNLNVKFINYKKNDLKRNALNINLFIKIVNIFTKQSKI